MASGEGMSQNNRKHISVEELLDRTNSLSYNQLVIQRLTSSIIKDDCKGLKDFFDCDLKVKRTTRSSDKGYLQPATMNNIPRYSDTKV
jgi:hypothetical protein